MATFAITTTVNIDSLASKAGSDTYNINGGYLTVDQDSRFGTNNNVSASMGNITMSAALGGTIEFKGSLVRLIPFNTGAGTVPASNTTISQGSASGLLIGVYSALNVAPTAAAASMPTSGYIKIKQWNSVAYAAGALTGVSATATNVDQVGWIEIAGVDALTATVNRLNTFKATGEWYVAGSTTGSRATTYQLPTNGTNAFYLPGVWVETAVSSGVYEFYPCAGSLTALAANIAIDAVRGKFCWISVSGLLRFGSDGTNSTGGFLPVSGLNIRIPNVFFTCCAAAAPAVNTIPNATLATRFDLTTTGGGVINLDKTSCNWYLSLNQPFSVNITNTGIMTSLLITELASPVVLSQVGVGQEAANTQFGLSMATCFAGGTLSNCTWTRSALAAGAYVTTWTDCSGFTITNERAASLTKASSTTAGTCTLLRVSSMSWTSCTLGGGRVAISTCSDINFTNTIYYDHPATTTPATNPMYVWDMTTQCARIKLDGLTFGGLTMCQPYSGILNIGAAGCTVIQLRNLGTYSSNLDLGDVRQDDVAWTRVTTTATVTKNAHGLKTNDIIFAAVSSSVAAIVVGAKTVTVVDANTFTFVCLSAGTASGTICYYPTMSATLVALAAGAAASSIEVKRCYVPHIRTNLFSSDNSSKGVTFENILSDYNLVPICVGLNEYSKGLVTTPSLAAQTAVYGTHWFDSFTSGIPPLSASVPWSRITTTATVTGSLYDMRTNDLILVTTSSVAAAIVLGNKTITAISSSQFQFTCLNAGATAGTISFVPLHGRIGLFMNESTTQTSTTYTIDSGSAAFTSIGGLYMPNVNDQVTFVSPNYILGHTAFPPAEAIIAGGTLTNYDITYAIDKNDGNGFSSFSNLSYPRAGGGGSNGSTNVTMTDTTGVVAGDCVFGTNIGLTARVVSVTNITTVVVDIPNIGVVSGILRFTHQSAENNIDPSLGFKMKVRIKTSTANVTAITSLYWFTSSTNESRSYTYPLDLVSLTLTNLKNPTEVRVYNYATTTEIAGSENVTSGSFTTSIDVAAYPTVDISVLSLGYQNTRLLSQSLGTGLSIPVSQVIDRQYSNPT